MNDYHNINFITHTTNPTSKRNRAKYRQQRLGLN